MMITVLFWTVYALIGVGVARTVLKARVRSNLESDGRPNYGDPDVSGFAIMGGVFWPVTVAGVAAWLGVIRPVARTVGPWVARWFMAPTQAVVDAHHAEQVRVQRELAEALARDRKAEAEARKRDREAEARVSTAVRYGYEREVGPWGSR